MLRGGAGAPTIDVAKHGKNPEEARGKVCACGMLRLFTYAAPQKDPISDRKRFNSHSIPRPVDNPTRWKGKWNARENRDHMHCCLYCSTNISVSFTKC